MKDRTTKPVHTIKFGKIQASIWQNQTKSGPRFNVTLTRLYHENGEWKRSESFGRDELLTVSKAMNEAHTWIWAQAGEDKPDEERV